MCGYLHLYICVCIPNKLKAADNDQKQVKIAEDVTLKRWSVTGKICYFEACAQGSEGKKPLSDWLEASENRVWDWNNSQKVRAESLKEETQSCGSAPKPGEKIHENP